MSHEQPKKEKRNPNRERSLYLVNLIALSLVALAAVALAGILFVRARRSDRELENANAQLSALEGDDKTLYTEDEVSQKTQEARREGRQEEGNAIRTQIQSSLESGDSVTGMLRNLLSDDIVVVSDGRYYFYPVISTVEKNGFADGNFSFGDDGTLSYVGSDAAISTQKGVDVSSANGEIDWNAAAEAGVQFAMIRAGGRDDDGKLYADARFDKNMDGAIAAGIQVGAYWSLGAKDNEEASEEEDYMLTLLSPYRDKISYPVAVIIRNVPQDSRIFALTRTEWTDNLDTFCSGIQAGGYNAMIYGSLAGFVMKTDLAAIGGYQRWIQEFSDDLYFPYSFAIWQYESEGSVAGIDGSVHLDLAVQRTGVK